MRNFRASARFDEDEVSSLTPTTLIRRPDVSWCGTAAHCLGKLSMGRKPDLTAALHVLRPGQNRSCHLRWFIAIFFWSLKLVHKAPLFCPQQSFYVLRHLLELSL